MSDAKGLIFDINENEIMSHIEDGTLSQFLESWRNTQLIKLAKEPKECEWIHYNYRTIAPKHHDINNPYWRIPENMDKLKYCPYCGRKIKVIE